MGAVARWLDRWQERRAAARYWRRMDKATTAWLASEKHAQIKACPHTSRRPNPDSIPREGWALGEICNDCGVGYVRRTAP